MIRYRFQGLTPRIEAAEYVIPASKRLAGRGPWMWTQENGYTVATLADIEANEWSEWKPGLDGVEVSLANPLPAWDFDYYKSDTDGIRLALSAGDVMIRPLSMEGRSVDWNGDIGEPVSDYGKACVAILERVAAGEEIPVTDRALIELCRESIKQCMRLTDEMIHAFGFINSDDVSLIMGAIADCPKA